MCQVRRIKGPTKNTQPVDWRQTQTQSLGTKKWLSKRASGEPGSSWRW
jgi:hypothetical protein